MPCRRPVLSFFALTLLTALPLAAQAVPAEIILVRHGEKINPFQLSKIGEERAHALAQVYLGKNASHSILPKGEEPAALMTVTLHTIETMTPTALSWRMPETAYTAVPEYFQTEKQKKAQETQRTQEAAYTLLHDPKYDGKVVIVMWEHARIASQKLEEHFPDQQVTFRQLLHLAKLPGVPKTWPKHTFDYFWIVKYQGNNPDPVSFQMIKQTYTGKYANLPQNDWGKPE
ncbi:histidine phosphatase family protein [Acidithiobacillus sp. CV18-2]|uniref:Histidine phosphatase family protein n=1 Tax=Igneacidithiobacillus copahuensis TaxID=2724909 RepID=A0AAE3CJX5_9PROT|nr:hypothetical protein [Igneacidithiobacillus copahuensis]MBU2755460.1 histidine phosphatase family protein [Acidithiobacillus sp. CV18-3]MBU2757894.1 histidine phosphatase family protein [Acidithiobacillus sp. BN09-2]MBU2778186.1 histidine phosphatase family protein [Acidithiobacillus sp. CV18-2]MBU2797009.1 histidine phosphatase family protein [Acidithiobacillus sp. VAN18-2]MBU2800539.1 histidine phosphatase family protein [Acidithiobacillus sp. VAN18-4]UTV80490.1 hypothetical protein MQE2